MTKRADQPRAVAEPHWWPVWELGMPVVVNLALVRKLEPVISSETEWYLTWSDGMVTSVSTSPPPGD